MIGIVDYGCGNLFSLKSSFNVIGADSVVCASEKRLSECDGIVLPGVGAFADAADKLNKSGLGAAVKALSERVPILGICLGMQLLFDKSFEYGEHDGLGLISGDVKPLAGYVERGLKIPHMGWNALQIASDCPLFKYVRDGDFVYFVHSFFADAKSDSVCAYTDYGGRVTAAVQNGNVFGTQFHPEKSGEVGLSVLKAFAEMCV